VASLIQALFRSGAYTADAVPSLADEAGLLREERAWIEGAVPKRRAEFATARVLARRGLAALGLPPARLVPPAHRAPIWPPGVVGSISHTTDYCGVVLQRSPPVRSLGFDAEVLRPVDPDVIAHITTPRERAWLAGRPRADRTDLALLLFSAKEAYYKCQYPLTATFLDFPDVELEVALDRGTFSARLLRPLPTPSIRAIEGKFAFDADKVLCGVELPT
jgi:enterobactin synthetase component D / holo-[acyl-carrier protein] synthase